MSRRKANKHINLEKVKGILLERGISQADFGRQIDMEDRSLIGQKLNNQLKVSWDEAVRMARVLEVSLDELAI